MRDGCVPPLYVIIGKIKIKEKSYSNVSFFENLGNQKFSRLSIMIYA